MANIKILPHLIVVSFFVLILIFQSITFCGDAQNIDSVQLPSWISGDRWDYSMYMDIDKTERFSDGTEIHQHSLQKNETVYINGTKYINGEECYVIIVHLSYYLKMSLKMEKSIISPFDGFSYNLTGQFYRRVSDFAFIGGECHYILISYGSYEYGDQPPLINTTKYDYYSSFIPYEPFISVRFPFDSCNNEPLHFISNITHEWHGTKISNCINSGISHKYEVSGISNLSLNIDTLIGIPTPLNVPAGTYTAYPIVYSGSLSSEYSEIQTDENGKSYANKKSSKSIEDYTEYYSPEVENILTSANSQIYTIGGMMNLGCSVDLIFFGSNQDLPDNGLVSDNNTKFTVVSSENDKPLYNLGYINPIIIVFVIALLIIIALLQRRKKHF